MSHPFGTQSVAEIRIQTGLCAGKAARTGSKTSSGKRMRFSRLPPYSILASVGERRKELVQQRAGGPLDVDGFDAAPRGALAHRNEGLAHAREANSIERSRRRLSGLVRDRR